VPLPDLRPGDERTALVQRLDQYRAIAVAGLADLDWDEASTRLLPATDLTMAGIVRHLASALRDSVRPEPVLEDMWCSDVTGSRETSIGPGRDA
jgi:hypothetical protein